MYCAGHSKPCFAFLFELKGVPRCRISGIPQRDTARFSRFSTTKQTGLGSDLS